MYENQHFENQFERKWIGLDKKKSFKKSSWFEELKCKLGPKIVHFFLFWFSFTLVAQTLWEWKMHHLWIEDIDESTAAPLSYDQF
jgi:hypothetical protein